MNKPIVLLTYAIVAGALTSGCCLCGPKPPVPTPGPPAKYAVLASTETATEDHVKYNSEFWYDLVTTYCTLIDLGFSEANIFVLYGDGNDFVSSVPQYKLNYCGDSIETEITDMPLEIQVGDQTGVAKNNLCNVLCCMAGGYPARFQSQTCKCRHGGESGIDGFKCSENKVPILGPNDFLAVWIKGHGHVSNTTSCATSWVPRLGATLRDSELKGLITDLQPDRRAFFFETCDAGGWLDDLKNDQTTVLTSSGEPAVTNDCIESSWSSTFPETNENTGANENIIHGRFAHWLNVAFERLATSGSDQDGNHLVSIDEGFDALRTKLVLENMEYEAETSPDRTADIGGVMHSAMEIPDGIARCLFLRRPIPGRDDDVFSRDHDEDDASVPSDTLGPTIYSSPDLWVRHSVGGLPHELPKLNHVNHIYVKVYNIGCADPGEIDVKFYWAPWDDPDAWSFIGSDVIQPFPPGKQDLAHIEWTPTNPPFDPSGVYWIIAVLSAGEDLPTDGKTITNDDNKISIITGISPG